MARRSASGVWVASRRELLALTGGALLAGRARAEGPAERQFLFLFCDGGWDPLCVFSPVFGADGVDMDPLATLAQAGGISFVDHPQRPAVRAFFERHADRTAVLNGFEVQSVAHERCQQLLFTGTAGAADDWGAILAGSSAVERLLPQVVVSGPAWSDQFGDKVVRVGTSGQLPSLLDGSALARGAHPITPRPADAAARMEAYVQARAAAAATRARPGWERVIHAGYRDALARGASLAAYGDLLSAASPDPFDLLGQLALALDCLELGLTRCASVRYLGVWGLGWDTHADNDEVQTMHFEELFGHLDELVGELDTRIGTDGLPLSQSVTVVVCSEMGRDPKLNEWDGRHHWTYTSAMLFGAGVAGGRVVGALDGAGRGQAVDPARGDVDAAGVALTSANLGATLLQLGGVDPEAWLPGVVPIDALQS